MDYSIDYTGKRKRRKKEWVWERRRWWREESAQELRTNKETWRAIFDAAAAAEPAGAR